MIFRKAQNDGISLRTINLCQIIGTILVSALLFYFTYHLTGSFQRLRDNSEQHIELRKAARELMDASDYLTEQVQRFCVTGDREFLDAYFSEAFVENHREEAISTMTQGTDNQTVLESLQLAMNSSVGLMNREYYAMKLVVEAKEFGEYPEALRDVQLSAADEALSPDEKMRLAAESVHDNEYYVQKEEIRKNMQASLDELERMADEADASALAALRSEMNILRLIIALYILAVFVMVWVMSHLGISPVLNAVDRIREDSPIPEVGANEFRYLARAYNHMYEVYRSSLERLNFKASHDELTGAYNRAGYELLLTSIDLNNTYMFLFDVDNFKQINDTYGHETGDKILVKLVRILKNNFREEDYICRLGGDEFVVFMIHSKEMSEKLIADKMDDINAELEQHDDGLPPASISVGVVHGSDASDIENLFEKTDAAMYQSKRSGKHTYTYYSK